MKFPNFPEAKNVLQKYFVSAPLASSLGYCGFFHIKNYWKFEVGEPCGGVVPFVDLLHINKSNCTVWPTGSWAKRVIMSRYFEVPYLESLCQEKLLLPPQPLFGVSKNQMVIQIDKVSTKLDAGKGHTNTPIWLALTASMRAWHWHWWQLSVLDQDIPWQTHEKLMVSTHLKNISQIGNLSPIVRKKCLSCHHLVFHDKLMTLLLTADFHLLGPSAFVEDIWTFPHPRPSTETHLLCFTLLAPQIFPSFKMK